MEFDLYPAKDCEARRIGGFYGLNRSRRASAGEMADMRNMSSDEYPCASPRAGRVTAAMAPGEPLAAAAPDSTVTDKLSGFTGIAAGGFYYDGVRKSGQVELSDDFSWEIVRLGNLYVLNGCGENGSELYYYNVDTGRFDAAFREMSDLIVTAGKDKTGNYLRTFRYGFEEVYNYSVTAANGRVINNSDFFDKYSDNRRLPASNIFADHFEVGDELTIEGFPSSSVNRGEVWSYSGTAGEVTPQRSVSYDTNNTVDTDLYASTDELYSQDITSAVVKGFEVGTASLNGVTIYIHYIYFDLANKNGDAVDFDDMVERSHYCSGVRLTKRRRVFSHIAAHHNRLWGTSPNGNAIFASAADDVFSFTSRDILAKLAARLPSDSPGSFTELAVCGSELTAFKEDSITVVCGTNASNYSTYVIDGVGCTEGSTAAVTPEGVIFPARGGFYRFSGAAPVCISNKLREGPISAVSGFDGEKYYAAARDRDGCRRLYVYDTRRSCWHIEDDAEIKSFFRFKDGFYLVSGDEILSLNSAPPDEDWSFTSAPQIYDLDNRALNELWIRAEVAPGAYFSVETRFDGGEYASHRRFSEPGLHVFRCPVRAVSGNVWQYRVSGIGKVVIYDIEMRYGSAGRRHKEYVHQ